MGLNTSAYDNIVYLIDLGDVNNLKNYLANVTKTELRQYCSEPCADDPYIRTLIHHAVWKDDSQILGLLFDYCDGEIYLESVDYYGMTPLAASVNRNNYKAASFLLDKGVSINCDTCSGYLLLRTAVYNNNKEMVELLLKYNCVTQHEQTDLDSGSLLHIACDAGNPEMIRLLVERASIPVGIMDKYRIQGVHITASKNYVDVLAYLHTKGANLNAEDSLGNVPLGWAIFCESREVFDYLKLHGAAEKPFKSAEHIKDLHAPPTAALNTYQISAAEKNTLISESPVGQLMAPGERVIDMKTLCHEMSTDGSHTHINEAFNRNAQSLVLNLKPMSYMDSPKTSHSAADQEIKSTSSF